MNKSRILGLIGSGVFALIAIIVVFAIGVKFKDVHWNVNWRIHSCIKWWIHCADIMNEFKGLYAAGLVFALIGVVFAVLAIFLKDKTGRIMIILELVFIILGMLLIMSGTANFVSRPKKMCKITRWTLNTSDLFNTGILAANYLLTLAGGVTGIVLAALSIRWR
jgi:ABC-type Na+ efflux pump permease subunit